MCLFTEKKVFWQGTRNHAPGLKNLFWGGLGRGFWSTGSKNEHWNKLDFSEPIENCLLKTVASFLKIVVVLASFEKMVEKLAFLG